jgi:hypothetical protein
MHFKGINGKSPCRFCTMKATPRKAGMRTTYYMTRTSEHHQQNADYSGLPLREHEQIANMAKRIDDTMDEDEQARLQQESGINGRVRWSCNVPSHVNEDKD